MPIRASLHFHSTLLKAAEIKHFPDLFCKYLSENSENRNFQNHFFLFTICSYFTVSQKQSKLFLQHYILSKRSLTVVYYTTIFYSEKEHFVKSQ